jgi:hypothetical protein
MDLGPICDDRRQPQSGGLLYDELTTDASRLDYDKVGLMISLIVRAGNVVAKSKRFSWDDCHDGHVPHKPSA